MTGEEYLLHAARYEYGKPYSLDAIHETVAADANINARDEEGRTALYWAAAVRVKPVMDILLQAGADVHAKDNSGVQPSHEAASGRHRQHPDLSWRRRERPGEPRVDPSPPPQ